MVHSIGTTLRTTFAGIGIRSESATLRCIAFGVGQVLRKKQRQNPFFFAKAQKQESLYHARVPNPMQLPGKFERKPRSVF